MDALSGALDVLSAMVTPAVLISACGSLILTTSMRLSRSIERVRDVAKRLNEHYQRHTDAPQQASPEREHLTRQLHFAGRSAKLLQDAMTGLYLTLMTFVATIIAIGLFKSLDLALNWVPMLMALLGTGLLLYTSVLLIRESRLAWGEVHREMDYLTQR